MGVALLGKGVTGLCGDSGGVALLESICVVSFAFLGPIHVIPVDEGAL